MGPYKNTFFVSTVLILITSALQVLLPIIISLVVVDHVLMGETRHATPDMGMIAAMEWLARDARCGTAAGRLRVVRDRPARAGPLPVTITG